MARDQEYDNSNSGALFVNNRRTSPKAPEWRGSITIKTPEGEVLEYWVSCWEKVSRSGDDFMSLALQLKEDADGRESDDRRGGNRSNDRDDRRGSFGRGRRDDRNDDRRDARSSRSQRDEDRESPRNNDDRRSTSHDLDDEVPF